MELEVKIEKELRNFTLRADFSLRDEVFALLGASGCGKSMTLKCIAGLERPDRGRIVLDGEVLFDSEQGIDLPPQKRRVGYLFQNFALFPNMTIADNIRFVARGTRQQREERVRENLARFALSELGNAYPMELSGGQQQRAALARILASDAKILLLDEPFSALDHYLKWKLELELREVLRQLLPVRRQRLPAGGQCARRRVELALPDCDLGRRSVERLPPGDELRLCILQLLLRRGDLRRALRELCLPCLIRLHERLDGVPSAEQLRLIELLLRRHTRPEQRGLG